MSALDKNPTNVNFLDPHKFSFNIRRLPHVNFFIQKVNLPSLTLPSVTTHNPFSTIPQPGDRISWGNLKVTFKVDEELKNWEEIFNWLIALGFPDEHSQYNEIVNSCALCGEGIKSDIELIVNNNNNNPSRTFTFRDCFPTFLSELEFITTDPDVNFLTATAEFVYISYKISLSKES